VSSRVLVVDDEPDLLESMTRLLGRFGYTCLAASSGTEAIALIETDPRPALVVTDLHMPGADGIAVARRAREQHPPIPVVLMTGYPDLTASRGLSTLGASARIAKPFRNADLLDAVRCALSEKTTDAALET